MRRGPVVWQPDGRGWRRVRGRVPAEARSAHASERVPRPPSFRFTAAGVEDSPRASAVARPAELERLGGELARELAREVVDRLGVLTTAVVVGVLLWRRKAKR